MQNFLRTARVATLVAATTIGAGIFALPYVFGASGFWSSTIILFALAGILSIAHISYFRALRVSGNDSNLASIVRDVFPSRVIQALTFLSVIGGLILALAAYLILGSAFLVLLFPALSIPVAMFMFWTICAGPLLFRERRLLVSEFSGAIALFVLLALFLGFAIFAGDLNRFPALSFFGTKNPLLALAPILFALAGWPAISEAYAMKHDEARVAHGKAIFERGIVWGTMFAAVGYFIFVIAAIALIPTASEDTLSAPTFSPWLLSLLAVFGLFAIWTSYLPEGLEIKRAMERGLHIKEPFASLGVVFLPPILILVGLKNFLTVISIAGGIFMALQYFFLVRASRKALRLKGITALLLDLAALLFLGIAIYEIYVFIIG